MSLDRRILTCALAVFALGASTAIAKTHATHSTRISGVVVSINVKRHTLKLRVTHAAGHRKAAARAAAVGGSSTVVVSFGQATVSGPNGAVSVGDDVTVTTDGQSGPTTVAASIAVVGQPNGGDSGKGAAVAGEVAALDPTAGTLTLDVTSTATTGQAQDGSVIVTVSASTILAVGDTNGDGKITLADVSVGDHIVVFTEDATADPIAAIGILDASRPGNDHQGDGSEAAPPTPIPGSVAALDTTAGTLLLKVTGGPRAGQSITVDVGAHTSFGGPATDGGSFGLADVKTGDSVTIYTPDPTATPLVAVGVVDQSAGASGTPAYDTFNGTVAGKSSAGVAVTVSGDGPLAGQTVNVNVTASTRFKGVTTDGTAFTLDDIQVGDQLRVYTTTLDPAALVAVAIGDGPPTPGATTPPTPASPPSTPPGIQRFGAVVTAVRGDGLTVSVLSDGPLHGQSVIVSVPASASLAPDPQTGAGKTLATISVGDAVEISTANETGSPIVALGVVDDGVYSDS